MALDGKLTDLTMGELRSVLATIAGIEAGQIRDWLIVIETLHECGDPACQSGNIATINSRASEYEADDAISESFSLQLAAEMISSIATRMVKP